jgi:para-nitrobenzyl esterase
MLPIGLVAAVATLASLAMAVPEVVELPNGRSAQGTTQGGIRSFLGMPYAQPPVNGLRFAAPVPVNSSTWSGLRKFSQYGNRCYDLSKGDTGLFAVPGIVYASKQNEDCLNLK